METALAIDFARIQFAFTVAFHIIFPAFTIGLASYLAVLEGLWLWTGRQVYIDVYRYWLKIFAVSFAMGVVSGIVMSYQFGTNWSVFADKVGPVLGAPMAYEVLSAFFLEAGFLGIMLFGMKRVGRTLHFAATLMVALGTFFSAFWILSVNSWMQTPAGYSINDAGQFIPVDWWQVIFNPSFPYRLAHMLLAAYLTTAFVVGGVAAFHLLRDRTNEAARLMFSMAMWMAALVAPLQIGAGDLHGLNTLEHQPTKVAAMEGHYESRRGAPLILFGVPDDEAEVLRYALEIPYLGSFILTHDWLGEVRGLKAWPRDERPPVAIVFYAFRVMVGIGLIMAAIGAWSLWSRYRGRLFEPGALHRSMVWMTPAGFVAVLAGWITTEVGRQPYTIYGLLRTADAASPVAAPAVAASLTAFVIVYCLLFGIGTYYLVVLMRQPPHPGEPGPEEGKPIRTAGITPIAAADRQAERNGSATP